MGELNEILVDRISPQDARALKGFEGIGSLKGIGFAHFAAFLSRAYRENDYLLGRLHAVDRLIDIVCDSAGIDCTAKIDIAGAQAACLHAGARCRGEASRRKQGADRGACGVVWRSLAREQLVGWVSAAVAQDRSTTLIRA